MASSDNWFDRGNYKAWIKLFQLEQKTKDLFRIVQCDSKKPSNEVVKRFLEDCAIRPKTNKLLQYVKLTGSMLGTSGADNSFLRYAAAL